MIDYAKMTNDSFGYWLPFTDKLVEGNFINIDTKESFNETLFEPGQPNGGENQNCLELWSGAAYDFFCDKKFRE